MFAEQCTWSRIWTSLQAMILVAGLTAGQHFLSLLGPAWHFCSDNCSCSLPFSPDPDILINFDFSSLDFWVLLQNT
jgi:hypothetical protein